MIPNNKRVGEVWAKFKNTGLLYLHPPKKRDASKEKKDGNTLKQSPLLLLLQQPSNVTQDLIT